MAVGVSEGTPSDPWKLQEVDFYKGFQATLGISNSIAWGASGPTGSGLEQGVRIDLTGAEAPKADPVILAPP